MAEGTTFRLGTTATTAPNAVRLEAEMDCFVRDLDVFIESVSSEKHPDGRPKMKVHRTFMRQMTDGYRVTMNVEEWGADPPTRDRHPGWARTGEWRERFVRAFEEGFPGTRLDTTGSSSEGRVGYHVHASFEYLSRKYSINNLLRDALLRGQKNKLSTYALMLTYVLAMWLCVIIQALNKPEKYDIPFPSSRL